jgi:hypothetical protein
MGRKLDPQEAHRRALAKTYAAQEAAFTRKETKAIQNAQVQVDRNGKRWTKMKIDGVEFLMAVEITLADGTKILDPLTKAQRRELRKRLGLRPAE